VIVNRCIVKQVYCDCKMVCLVIFVLMPYFFWHRDYIVNRCTGVLIRIGINIILYFNVMILL